MPKEKTPLSADRILRHIHDGLLIVDVDGEVLYTNAAFRAMVGRDGDDLDGTRLQELVPEAALEMLDPRRFDTAGEEPAVHFNLCLERPDGESGSYCFTAYPVRDDNGRLIGVLQNFRGMDALRSMILQLEEVNAVIRGEKERTEQILDSIGEGVFAVDRDRRILSFSRRMTEITGVKSEEAVGRTCMEVLQGSKCETDCPLTWSLANEAVVDRCSEPLAPDGGRAIPVEITTAFLRDEMQEVIGLTAFVSDRSEIERLRSELQRAYASHRVIGRSPQVQRILQQVETVAETDATVLITGESGTGKEVVARAIHDASFRKEGPFVVVNCAALTETLLESELFGHVRGSFTGAVRDKAGRFELASGGTILLDEVGDTSPALQAKLLRVLDKKTVERVGDNASRPVDVRILAATNKDLEEEVNAGRFRQDLYYRLVVVPIQLPPLRERKADIPALVEHFIGRLLPKYWKNRETHFRGISNRALAMLMSYDWPGNVRELEHAIEFALISTTSDRIERTFLPAPLQHLSPVPAVGVKLDESEEGDAEETALRTALERNKWNMSRTAEDLGISRTTLWRRLRRHGLTDRQL